MMVSILNAATEDTARIVNPTTCVAQVYLVAKSGCGMKFIIQHKKLKFTCNLWTGKNLTLQLTRRTLQ